MQYIEQHLPRYYVCYTWIQKNRYCHQFGYIFIVISINWLKKSYNFVFRFMYNGNVKFSFDQIPLSVNHKNDYMADDYEKKISFFKFLLKKVVFFRYFLDQIICEHYNVILFRCTVHKSYENKGFLSNSR